MIEMPSSGATKSKLTVLISSAGRRVELINCFRQSARELGCELKVIATDARPEWTSACQHADKSFAVPRCDDPAFLARTLEICKQENVSLVIPTIDPELLIFADARGEFAKCATTVSVSTPDVVALARNKLESNRFFSEIGLAAPRSALLRDVLRDESSWQFPLVTKPINGSSSIGLHIVNSSAALRSLTVDPDRYVVQDQVRGREFTVNLFFDASRLRCATQHHRVEIRGGEVSKGVTERVPSLAAAAETLGAALAGRAFGALNFQAVLTEDGTPHLLEMNARFSGGYPLVHRAGAQFTKWLLEPLLNRPSTAENVWQEGVAMLRYDAAFFLSPKEQK